MNFQNVYFHCLTHSAMETRLGVGGGNIVGDPEVEGEEGKECNQKEEGEDLLNAPVVRREYFVSRGPGI